MKFGCFTSSFLRSEIEYSETSDSEIGEIYS